MEEKISKKLKTSPIKINNPLKKRRPEQKRVNWKPGSSPKTSIRKAVAETMSIAPRILRMNI